MKIFYGCNLKRKGVEKEKEKEAETEAEGGEKEGQGKETATAAAAAKTMIYKRQQRKGENITVSMLQWHVTGRSQLEGLNL